MINIGYIEIEPITIILILVAILIGILAGIALYKILKNEKEKNVDGQKNNKKTLSTIIAIIINSLILIGINKILFSNLNEGNLPTRKEGEILYYFQLEKLWKIYFIKMNFLFSIIVTLISSYIMFSKEDFKKKEIWKTIICMVILVIIPAIVPVVLKVQHFTIGIA